MSHFVRNTIMMLLMFIASFLASAFQPTQKLAEISPKVVLSKMVPYEFGPWKAIENYSNQIVNPQQKEVLDKIYSQTLSRAYINPDGAIVMLSIAYGENQTDGLALHYPEICYPAQGFQVVSSKSGILKTYDGNISVKRLKTKAGQRSELVTYWTTLGNNVVNGNFETKLAQLKYGAQGLIPDGLIFRISSISNDDQQAFKTHAEFSYELTAALDSFARTKLAGIRPGN